MNIDEMQKLLDDFDCLPKIVKQPTYLELCDYSGRRFEEICSRLLKFYLVPKNEHGFHDLFLSSLFEMLGLTDLEYREADIATKLEVNAEGKRLDILVEGKSFAIGIENKIEAGVYNPLEKYKNLVEKKGKKNTFLIVLSVRQLTEAEIEKAKTHSFKCYTYEEYFGIIKRNIGNYMNQGNLKYLAFIMDFIKTLENWSGVNVMDIDKKMKDFFKANGKRIEELQKIYGEYTSEPFRKLRKLQEKIAEITKESDGGKSEWNIYDYWLLYYRSSSGIQVCATLEEDATVCHIFIVVPNNDEEAKKAWSVNNEKIIQNYHDYQVEQTDYECRLSVARVPFREDKDFDPAVAKLYEVYQFVKTLTV